MTNQDWISIDDALPDCRQLVLVYGPENDWDLSHLDAEAQELLTPRWNICVGFYDKETTNWHTGNAISGYDVEWNMVPKFWMPTPEAPRV